MKVWYLSAHDQPRGQSSRTYDFSKELVRRGHSVTMFTNSYCHFTHEERLQGEEKWRIEEIDGIRVAWMRTIHYTGNGFRRGLNMLSNAYRAFQVARVLSERPDVVIGPSVPLLTGWVAARLARRNRAAFVFEVRDVWPIILVYDGGMSKSSPVYWAFRLMEKYLYRTAERISTVLPAIGQHVRESGSDPSKIVWVPNGVDFERMGGYGAYDGGAGTPLVAMYVGGYSVEHDVMTIVKAAEIMGKGPYADRCRFVLIGDGLKRSECETEVARNGLQNVEFRDRVPKHEVARMQSESDILIACVKDTRAFTFGLNLNKMFDYLASGRPVIFAGRAPNDPVAESGAGFTVPPEDPTAMAAALQKLIDMPPGERARIGALGRRYVEKEYDMRGLGERMEVMLLQAMGEKESCHGS